MFSASQQQFLAKIQSALRSMSLFLMGSSNSIVPLQAVPVAMQPVNMQSSTTDHGDSMPMLASPVAMLSASVDQPSVPVQAQASNWDAAAEQFESEFDEIWDKYFAEVDEAYTAFDAAWLAAESVYARKWERAHSKWRPMDGASTYIYHNTKSALEKSMAAARALARTRLENTIEGARLKREDALVVLNDKYGDILARI